jgi:hypothetical protein
MPYLTLTLNGLPVDLPPDAQVALSYRANDLRNLDTREAAFSEQFTLPLTARNAAVLDNPQVLDNQTLTPYRLLPAVLTSPGGTVLLRGFAILEASGSGYEVTLTDALGGLFAQVGQRALRAIDLSAWDHPYLAGAVLVAQTHNFEQGYTYVLADDGRLTTRDPAQGVLWYELTHAVYYRAVLAALVAQALPGYRLTGSLLNEPRFQAAVFPRATPTPRLRASTLAPFAIQALRDAPVREHDNGSGKYYPLVAFPRQLSGNPVFFNGTAFLTPPYRADIRVSARLLVRLDAEFVPNNFTNTVAAVRIVDATDAAASTVHEQIICQGVGAQFTALVAQQPLGLRAVEFDYPLPGYLANRQLAVQLRLENGAGLTIGPGSTITFAIGEHTYPGAAVQLDASLPDISQADALKLLCNQFNVVVQANAEERTIRFDTFNDLERNRPRAVDWSAKLDYGQRPRLAYRLGDYAQRNTFAYAPPIKDYAPLLLGAPVTLAQGQGVLPVPNQTLPLTAEAYAAPLGLPLAHPALNGTLALPWLPFVAEPDPAHPPTLYAANFSYGGAAPHVLYAGQRWRCTLDPAQPTRTLAGTPPSLLPVPVTDTPSAPPLLRLAWELAAYTASNEALPTCALLQPLPAAPGLRVVDDSPDSASFVPAFTLTRTGFTFDALLSDFHEGMRRALSRARLLSVALRLTPVDIAALDFTVPVQLRAAHLPGYGALSGLFYLNDIDQFVPGRPGAVRVTLLALGDQVPALAPAVTVPLVPPAGTQRRALLLESGQPLLTEAGPVLLLET